MDTQLVSITLDGEAEGRTVLKMKYLEYPALPVDSDEEDEDEDEEMQAKPISGEEKEVILCSLTPGKVRLFQ